MKLSHFSARSSRRKAAGTSQRDAAKPLALSDLWDVKEQPTKDAIKPNGLWVSCDGEHDWEAWCRGEDFRIDDYKLRQQVTLRSNVLCSLEQAGPGMVLHLKDARDIDNFSKIYKTALYPGDDAGWINWPAVAAEYDGIIVSPYIYERRLGGPIRCMWYYPWDCASGCIWRPTRIIESIGEPVPIDWTTKLLTSSEAATQEEGNS